MACVRRRVSVRAMIDHPPEALPPVCMQVLLHVWDYLDGRLAPEETRSLRAHLDECAPCFEYELFQQSYLEAMSALRVTARAPWHVRAKVLETLESAAVVENGAS